MTPQRVSEHADRVQRAHGLERRLRRTERKIEAGHVHLRALRDDLAARLQAIVGES